MEKELYSLAHESRTSKLFAMWLMCFTTAKHHRFWLTHLMTIEILCQSSSDIKRQWKEGGYILYLLFCEHSEPLTFHYHYEWIHTHTHTLTHTSTLLLPQAWTTLRSFWLVPTSWTATSPKRPWIVMWVPYFTVQFPVYFLRQLMQNRIHFVEATYQITHLLCRRKMSG